MVRPVRSRYGDRHGVLERDFVEAGDDVGDYHGGHHVYDALHAVYFFYE